MEIVGAQFIKIKENSLICLESTQEANQALRLVQLNSPKKAIYSKKYLSDRPLIFLLNITMEHIYTVRVYMNGS